MADVAQDNDSAGDGELGCRHDPDVQLRDVGSERQPNSGDAREFYPVTKTIYALVGRIEPNAVSVASALGVLGMVLLTVSCWWQGKTLGKKLGQLFRAS